MTRDALPRMDVDTNWVNHRRWRKLQRLAPTEWPSCVVAYFALLGEAWRSRTREVTVDDAYPTALRDDPALIFALLRDVGLVDSQGRIPADSWEDWYGPAAARIEQAKHAAGVRWHGRGNAQREKEREIPKRPKRGIDTQGENVHEPSGARGGLTPVRDLLPKGIAEA